MPAPKLRLAFMGTPSFALPTLEALIDAGHEIAMVWTKPPAAQARGLKTQPSAVAKYAAQHDLPLSEYAHLRDEDALHRFCALNLDAAIIVSYGIILPPAFLDAPRLGCLNLHPSLLPRWRGAAPIERALWAGDQKTGITIMRIGAGIDDGDILLQKEIEIGDKNAGALRNDSSKQGAQLMVAVLEKLAADEITPRPQNHAEAVMAPRLSAHEETIDWQRSATDLLHQIRALAPRPGAWFMIERDNKKIRIRLLEASIAAAEGVAGAVLDDREAIIACGRGALRLKQIQREGKKIMSAADFLKGTALIKGERLG